MEPGISRTQVVVVILFATVCVAVGETLLSVGMRQANRAGVEGLRMIAFALSNRFVVGGTMLMLVYFALYALALSWADISYVLPFTALSYLFVAGMAKYCLQESVTPTRWLGTLLIVLGVIVVGFGERR